VIEYPCARAHAGSGIGQLATAERHAEMVVWHFSAFLARARARQQRPDSAASGSGEKEIGWYVGPGGIFKFETKPNLQ
jgi:hypothetical protein